MTVGAAGVSNVAFKALLDEGEEVIVPSPYFMDSNSTSTMREGSFV